MNSFLPNIWLLILCFEIGLYIMLDGGDLGVGALSLLPQREGGRPLMMQTIGPIWDANETWLIIAAGTLFGAFPLAYGVILNALYIPIMFTLFGLIFRAVSFEFRERSANKYFWELMFGMGSLAAILGQGFAAGGLLSGIAVVNGIFAGGAFDWFTPLTLFVAVGVLFSYAVVGYAYLIKRADYELKEESFFRVIIAAGISFISFFAATLLLPQMHELLLQRWTQEPSEAALIAIALLIGITGLFVLHDAWKKQNAKDLNTLCRCIFVLSFVGMLVGVYPFIIPPGISIYEAAASPATLQFMLYGMAPLLPIVLAYNFYMYRVFKKDLKEGAEGY